MHNQHVLTDTLALFGRILFSSIFILAGVGKLMDIGGTLTTMSSAGLPFVEVILIVTIIFDLGGGLMILFVWKAKFGALLLFLFMLCVTYTFHDFWTFEAAAMQNQLHHFLKNLSMVGATLYIMAYGAGNYSFDARKKRKVETEEN